MDTASSGDLTSDRRLPRCPSLPLCPYPVRGKPCIASRAYKTELKRPGFHAFAETCASGDVEFIYQIFMVICLIAFLAPYPSKNHNRDFGQRPSISIPNGTTAEYLFPRELIFPVIFFLSDPRKCGLSGILNFFTIDLMVR